jgi:HlyD family secretion protein
MKQTLLTLIVSSTLVACAPAEDVNRVVGELASDRIELTAEFSEAIVDIAVAEGSSVSKDQVLIRQNDEKALARLADAEAVHLQALARLDELLRGPRSEQIAAGRATVEGATQDLEFRQSEQTRIKEIHQRGLASAEELDRANAGLDAAEATLKYRLAQLEELLAGTTIEELAQAEQSVQQAAARQDSAQIDVSRHVISAPVDGVVDSRLFEIGERPGAGQPVIIVLAATQVHARVYVPEKIRVHITSGTKALIHIDGLDDPVEGRVRWVASEAAFTPYYALTERDRGRLSYAAKVDIVEERDRLPDGVPVEVEFELD